MIEVAFYGTFPNSDAGGRDTYLKCVYRDGKRVYFSDGNNTTGNAGLDWMPELPADSRSFPAGAYLICSTRYGNSYGLIVPTPGNRAGAVIIIKTKDARFRKGEDVISILRELREKLPTDWNTKSPEYIPCIGEEAKGKLKEYTIPNDLYSSQSADKSYGLFVYKSEGELNAELTHIHQKGYDKFNYVVFHNSSDGFGAIRWTAIEGSIEPMYQLLSPPDGVSIEGGVRQLYFNGDTLRIKYEKSGYDTVVKSVKLGSTVEKQYIDRVDSKFEISIKSAEVARIKFSRRIEIKVEDEDGIVIKNACITRTRDGKQIENGQLSIEEGETVKVEIKAKYYESKHEEINESYLNGQKIQVTLKAKKMKDVEKEIRLPSGETVKIHIVDELEERSPKYQELKKIGDVLIVKKPHSWISKLRPGKKVRRFLEIFSVICLFVVAIYAIIAAFIFDDSNESQTPLNSQETKRKADNDYLYQDSIWKKSDLQSEEMLAFMDVLNQNRIEEAFNKYVSGDENKLWSESKSLWYEIKQRMFDGTLQRDSVDTIFNVIIFHENLNAIKKSLPPSRKKEKTASSVALTGGKQPADSSKNGDSSQTSAN